jgi:hypothetical protein
MKTNKQIFKIIVAISAFWLVSPNGYQANAATIGYVTTFGAFLSSTGSSLSSGGVSVGFFTTSLPTAAELSGMTNPWSTLASAYGFKDVRTLLDANSNLPTMSVGGSWDYAAGGVIGGTLTVPNTPANVVNAINGNDALSAFAGGTAATATQLWVFAFNQGTYANGFAGSTAWAATTANALAGATNDWLYPTSSENIQLSQLNAVGEILIGTDGAIISGGNANNVYLAAIVPEPSSASLLALGVAGLVALRVRRKS